VAARCYRTNSLSPADATAIDRHGKRSSAGSPVRGVTDQGQIRFGKMGGAVFPARPRNLGRQMKPRESITAFKRDQREARRRGKRPDRSSLITAAGRGYEADPTRAGCPLKAALPTKGQGLRHNRKCRNATAVESTSPMRWSGDVVLRRAFTRQCAPPRFPSRSLCVQTIVRATAGRDRATRALSG